MNHVVIQIDAVTGTAANDLQGRPVGAALAANSCPFAAKAAPTGRSYGSAVQFAATLTGAAMKGVWTNPSTGDERRILKPRTA